VFTNIILTWVALILVGAGLILLPLPIPLGAIMIISGTSLAIAANSKVKHLVIRYRRRHPKVEAVIDRFKGYLPHFIRKPVDDSDPDLQ
jgi:uncharacterized membrane protein